MTIEERLLPAHCCCCDDAAYSTFLQSLKFASTPEDLTWSRPFYLHGRRSVSVKRKMLLGCCRDELLLFPLSFPPRWFRRARRWRSEWGLVLRRWDRRVSAYTRESWVGMGVTQSVPLSLHPLPPSLLQLILLWVRSVSPSVKEVSRNWLSNIIEVLFHYF